MISRRLVYGVGLWVFLACLGMTIASIIIPEWITWDTPSPVDKQIHLTYGLHQRCSSIDAACRPFPLPLNCAGPNASFCTQWRTAGFFMNFSVIISLAALVAFVAVLAGGPQRRERGWPVLCMLVCVAGVTQAVAMAIVADMSERDKRFRDGWVLGRAWVLCVVSWVLELVVGVGIAVMAMWLPTEGGYELIPDGGDRLTR